MCARRGGGGGFDGGLGDQVYAVYEPGRAASPQVVALVHPGMLVSHSCY